SRPKPWPPKRPWVRPKATAAMSARTASAAGVLVPGAAAAGARSGAAPGTGRRSLKQYRRSRWSGGRSPAFFLFRASWSGNAFPGEVTAVAGVGDRVAINTTAVDLGLGTGGAHFVVHVLGRERPGAGTKGHIMKLRYTPLQVAVLAAEEPDSPHHHVLAREDDLEGMPV